MPYALSFLDKSPIHDGEAVQTALARTIKLAQKAETAGFHRFWVAEHHNSPELASSSPEVLISFCWHIPNISELVQAALCCSITAPTRSQKISISCLHLRPDVSIWVWAKPLGTAAFNPCLAGRL